MSIIKNLHDEYKYAPEVYLSAQRMISLRAVSVPPHTAPSRTHHAHAYSVQYNVKSKVQYTYHFTT